MFTLKLSLKKTITDVYVFFALATLIMHIFNDVNVGGIKIFYFFIILTFAVSIFMQQKFDLIDFLCYFFSIITVVSGYFSIVQESFVHACNMSIIVIALNNVRRIPSEMFSKLAVGAMFFTEAALMLRYIQEPHMRYSGWYSDPNYLTLSLIILLYMNIKQFDITKNKIEVFLIIVNAILCVFIVMLTQSRTGLVVMLLILFCWSWCWIKKHLIKASIFIAISAMISAFVAINYFPKELDFFYSRLNQDRQAYGDDMDSARNLRLELSIAGMKYLLVHPEHWIQGIGISSTAYYHSQEIFPSRGLKTRDHNTFSSVLVEQGIVAFSIYILFLFLIFRKNSRKTLLNMDVVFWGLVSLFSVSIWTITFLPVWFFYFYQCSQHAELIDVVERIQN